MRTHLSILIIISLVSIDGTKATPTAPPRSEGANTDALYSLSPKGERGMKRQDYLNLEKGDPLGAAANRAESAYKQAARLCMGAGNMATGTCTDSINNAMEAQRNFEGKLPKPSKEEAAWGRIEARVAQRAAEKKSLVRSFRPPNKPLPKLPQ